MRAFIYKLSIISEIERINRNAKKDYIFQLKSWSIPLLLLKYTRSYSSISKLNLYDKANRHMFHLTYQ